nr:MAG TPA: hypothetical protein [Caudoviricetes sp.]
MASPPPLEGWRANRLPFATVSAGIIAYPANLYNKKPLRRFPLLVGVKRNKEI